MTTEHSTKTEFIDPVCGMAITPENAAEYLRDVDV